MNLFSLQFIMSSLRAELYLRRLVERNEFGNGKHDP